MRSFTTTLSEIYNQHTRISFAGPSTGAAAGADPDTWRMRAIRDASLVRRVLRGAQMGGCGAAGAAATVCALEAGTVRDVLVTQRFLDSQPGSAANLVALAQAVGLEPTVLSGVAAFELDMVAGGVAALLQRPLIAVAAHAPV